MGTAAMNTEINAAGAQVVTDANVCNACKLALLLGTGVLSGAVDAGHSQCEGSDEMPCACGCDYSRGAACKECQRKGMNLDHHGQCVDRRDCSNAILAAFAAKRAERAARAAAAPEKRRSGGSTAQKRPCTCGCGETTGGGLYRPGHDARHVSQLVRRVKAGESSLDDARREVAHSDKLVAKLEKAVGA